MSTVSLIDTSTNTVVDTVSVGGRPYGVAITPDGNFAYVTNESSDTVSVIDTSTNTVTATIAVGAGPRGVAITPLTPDVNGSISSNHGHTVTITGAELDAGGAITLVLTLGNGHNHSLDLTAQQVINIADGLEVMEQSSITSSHSHTVTFN